MDYIDFNGRNRLLGSPEGMTDCGTLPVRVREDPQDGGVCIDSYWQPSEADIAQLLAGACVRLTVWGAGHPPVMLTVEDKP